MECEFCEKELDREKGEEAHGCLDCTCCVKAEKIMKLRGEIQSLKKSCLNLEAALSHAREFYLTESAAAECEILKEGPYRSKRGKYAHS